MIRSLMQELDEIKKLQAVLDQWRTSQGMVIKKITKQDADAIWRFFQEERAYDLEQ